MFEIPEFSDQMPCVRKETDTDASPGAVPDEVEF